MEDKKEGQVNKNSGGGVFLTKGMQISIPQFSIWMDDEGNLQSSPVTIHTGLDLCPYWLGIAYQHLLSTEKAHQKLMSCKETNDAEGMAFGLESEFLSGMQAIMASCIAIDAYYGSIVDRIEMPKDLTQTWRKNRTARYKQISEVLRMAFHMPGKAAENLREVLKQNFSFRDKAVHPPSGTNVPMVYPELNQATDWRYVTFRFPNAKTIVGLSLSVVAQTAQNPRREKYSVLEKYCKTLLEKLDPLIKQWEIRYEKLF